MTQRDLQLSFAAIVSSLKVDENYVLPEDDSIGESWSEERWEKGSLVLRRTKDGSEEIIHYKENGIVVLTLIKSSRGSFSLNGREETLLKAVKEIKNS